MQRSRASVDVRLSREHGWVGVIPDCILVVCMWVRRWRPGATGMRVSRTIDARAASIAEGGRREVSVAHLAAGRSTAVFAVRLESMGRGEDRFLRLCSLRSCALQHSLCESEQETRLLTILGKERVSITTTTTAIHHCYV
ncbi:hypothetical protein GMDG_04729 [Pseudogymnoascus destructans 20631-21]|uniref:Uncharacterized protein n=1 Tax=Pseudogymnoascus destructans (strain ATCC MYA-4855 / 20631-21) TaxID=658429 RepID=L8GB88_PSED2|nr:hypothetical protein GMDG_04729 [Pseudogymnoascus destructans 20631-21]